MTQLHLEPKQDCTLTISQVRDFYAIGREALKRMEAVQVHIDYYNEIYTIVVISNHMEYYANVITALEMLRERLYNELVYEAERAGLIVTLE